MSTPRPFTLRLSPSTVYVLKMILPVGWPPEPVVRALERFGYVLMDQVGSPMHFAGERRLLRGERPRNTRDRESLRLGPAGVELEIDNVVCARGRQFKATVEQILDAGYAPSGPLGSETRIARSLAMRLRVRAREEVSGG